MKETQNPETIDFEHKRHVWNTLSPVDSVFLISGSGSLGWCSAILRDSKLRGLWICSIYIWTCVYIYIYIGLFTYNAYIYIYIKTREVEEHCGCACQHFKMLPCFAPTWRDTADAHVNVERYRGCICQRWKRLRMLISMLKDTADLYFQILKHTPSIAICSYYY